MAIRKRGKGRWQVRVRPFPEVTLPTREAAEMIELDLKLRVKLGHLYREKPTRLGDELDGLFERKKSMGGKRGPLRPAGIRYYQDCVRPWGPLRDTPVPALRRRQVEDHIAARAAVAPTAARNELQFLKAALRTAQARGQQLDVGIFEIDPIRVEAAKVKRSSTRPARPRLLAPERVQRIVPFCGTVGLRFTEAVTLTDDRVDLEAATIFIPGRLNRAAGRSRFRSPASRFSSCASSSSSGRSEREPSSRRRREICTATRASSRLAACAPRRRTRAREKREGRRLSSPTSASTGSATPRSR